jgi:hypothetical protein
VDDNEVNNWRLIVGVLLAGVAFLSSARGQNVHGPRPLPHAHAHNDYRHPRPLLDALDRGFCSVEADIFLVDGELLVGHDRGELRAGRTLQSLYLDPLRARVERNSGRVYPGGPPFMLLVDIKRDGSEVYAVLREVLASYRTMLCGVEDGLYRERAIQVVISGDCPRTDIVADAQRFCGIDGRLGDLDSTAPAHLMPLISDRWSTHFSWRGDGDFPVHGSQSRHLPEAQVKTKSPAPGQVTLSARIPPCVFAWNAPRMACIFRKIGATFSL